MELRAWLSHAASVLPSEHPARHGRPVGSVERHLRRFFHSDFHGVRPSLPEVCPEDLALLGNGHRSSTDGSVTLHSSRVKVLAARDKRRCLRAHCPSRRDGQFHTCRRLQAPEGWYTGTTPV